VGNELKNLVKVHFVKMGRLLFFAKPAPCMGCKHVEFLQWKKPDRFATAQVSRPNPREIGNLSGFPLFGEIIYRALILDFCTANVITLLKKSSGLCIIF